MSEAPKFVCEATPEGDGTWLVEIVETHGWGSAEVDGLLDLWPRQRMGGTWTPSSRRQVGIFLTEARAQRGARSALRVVKRRQDERARKNATWRRNRARQPFTVTPEATR